MLSRVFRGSVPLQLTKLSSTSSTSIRACQCPAPRPSIISSVRVFHADNVKFAKGKKLTKKTSDVPVSSVNNPSLEKPQADFLELKRLIRQAISDVEGGRDLENAKAVLEGSLPKLVVSSDTPGVVKSKGRFAVSRDQMSAIYSSLASIEIAHKSFSVAKPLVEKALELAPEDPHLHFLLGLSYQGLEKYSEAVSAYDAALKLDEDMEDVTAAKLYKKAFDTKAPKGDIEGLKEHKRLQALAHRNLAELYLSSSKLKKAKPINILSELEAANSQMLVGKDPMVSFMIAQVFEKFPELSDDHVNEAIKNYDEAISLLLADKTALQSDKDRKILLADASARLGDAMVRKGASKDVASVIKLYERALTLDSSKYSYLHLEVADLYKRLNQTDFAIIHLHQMLKIETEIPRLYRGYLNLALIHLAQSPKKAVAQLLLSSKYISNFDSSVAFEVAKDPEIQKEVAQSPKNSNINLSKTDFSLSNTELSQFMETLAHSFYFLGSLADSQLALAKAIKLHPRPALYSYSSLIFT